MTTAEKLIQKLPLNVLCTFTVVLHISMEVWCHRIEVAVPEVGACFQQYTNTRYM